MRRLMMMAALAASLAAAQGVRAQKVTMEFDQDAPCSDYKTFTLFKWPSRSVNVL